MTKSEKVRPLQLVLNLTCGDILVSPCQETEKRVTGETVTSPLVTTKMSPFAAITRLRYSLTTFYANVCVIKRTRVPTRRDFDIAEDGPLSTPAGRWTVTRHRSDKWKVLSVHSFTHTCPHTHTRTNKQGLSEGAAVREYQGLLVFLGSPPAPHL